MFIEKRERLLTGGIVLKAVPLKGVPGDIFK